MVALRTLETALGFVARIGFSPPSIGRFRLRLHALPIAFPLDSLTLFSASWRSRNSHQNKAKLYRRLRHGAPTRSLSSNGRPRRLSLLEWRTLPRLAATASANSKWRAGGGARDQPSLFAPAWSLCQAPILGLARNAADARVRLGRSRHRLSRTDARPVDPQAAPFLLSLSLCAPAQSSASESHPQKCRLILGQPLLKASATILASASPTSSRERPHQARAPAV